MELGGTEVLEPVGDDAAAGAARALGAVEGAIETISEGAAVLVAAAL
jgi:hypothetical protein